MVACCLLVGCGAKVTFPEFAGKARAAATATNAFVKNSSDKKLFEEARSRTGEAVETAANSDFDKSETAKTLRLLKVILDGSAPLVAAGGDLTKVGASSPQSPLEAIRGLGGVLEITLESDEKKLSTGSPKP